MATEIYKRKIIKTIYDEEIEIIPLAIKYMKDLMYEFAEIQSAQNDDDTIEVLCECVRIAMKQYKPELSKSTAIVQDNFDLKTIYKILEYSAGIKINTDKKENISEEVKDNKSSGWEDLDLAKLETEVFMLGIWKNYDELESCISIEELMAILSAKRELDYDEKKFLAAIQGINLDENVEGDGKQKGQKEWEDLKARVFSKGQATDSNDILALQGQNARKAGFGIGLGLDYVDMRSKPN